MILAVVRSHYGEEKLNDSESIYRAGNALASWLGLSSWIDITMMQSKANRKAFRKIVEKAA